MLSRDWICLNRKCGRTFHSYEKGNPECEFCGCARVQWLPGGGHVAKAAPAADRTLRGLADKYNMPDMNSGSHSRLNRAMPKYSQVNGGHAPADGPVMQFAPGFSSGVNRQGFSTCEPSKNNVNFKAVAAAEKSLVPSRTYPQIGRDHWQGIRTQYRP
jgi:hypothetical protein